MNGWPLLSVVLFGFTKFFLISSQNSSLIVFQDKFVNMANNLESYAGRTVSVMTVDGRQIVGTLKGFDQTVNIVLDDCHERIYSLSGGVEQVPLGLYIIRGDNVAVVGEIDEELDKKVNYSIVRAPPLNPIVH